MAAKDETQQAPQEEKPKKSKLKLIIIIVLALLILGGGGFAVYMLFLKKPAPAPLPDNQTAQTTKAAPIADKKEVLPQIEIDPFIVNLADQNAKRYLKVKIALELSNKDLEEEIKKRTPEIRDMITMLLSSKTYADVATFDGKLALKTALISRLNSIVTKGKITNVFFVDFVVQ